MRSTPLRPEDAAMTPARTTFQKPRWPVRELLIGASLLSLAGCGEGGGLIAGTIIGTALSDAGDSKPSRHKPSASLNFRGDPSEVQVTAARLRSTAGGCEVDVTFKNLSERSLSAGFTNDILDAGGRQVASRSTAAQQVGPGLTAAVSSEGTTAGPSGVPCPPGGRAQLREVGVYNF